jgi:hypothetical protein
VAVRSRDDHDDVRSLDKRYETILARPRRVTVVDLDVDSQLGSRSNDFTLDSFMAADEPDAKSSTHWFGVPNFHALCVKPLLGSWTMVRQTFAGFVDDGATIARPA